jgi:hypothetical protein
MINSIEQTIINYNTTIYEHDASIMPPFNAVKHKITFTNISHANDAKNLLSTLILDEVASNAPKLLTPNKKYLLSVADEHLLGIKEQLTKELTQPVLTFSFAYCHTAPTIKIETDNILYKWLRHSSFDWKIPLPISVFTEDIPNSNNVFRVKDRLNESRSPKYIIDYINSHIVIERNYP